MAEITQMIRWNTNFVRSLAQSVLERAKVIRSGLVSQGANAPTTTQAAVLGKPDKKMAAAFAAKAKKRGKAHRSKKSRGKAKASKRRG